MQVTFSGMLYTPNNKTVNTILDKRPVALSQVISKQYIVSGYTNDKAGIEKQFARDLIENRIPFYWHPTTTQKLPDIDTKIKPFLSLVA